MKYRVGDAVTYNGFPGIITRVYDGQIEAYDVKVSAGTAPNVRGYMLELRGHENKCAVLVKNGVDHHWYAEYADGTAFMAKTRDQAKRLPYDTARHLAQDLGGRVIDLDWMDENPSFDDPC